MLVSHFVSYPADRSLLVVAGLLKKFRMKKSKGLLSVERVKIYGNDIF